jgi:transposase-like protein
LEGEWPYLWPDATCLRQREGGGTVSIAAIVAVAVNTERRREIVGLHIDPSEAERLWSSFLKSLVRRGLKGVRLVISDAHAGLNAAIARVRERDGKGVAFTGCARPWPTFQRDRRPWYWRRCAKPSCNPTKPVRGLSGGTADHLRPRFPKLAALMDDNEHDVLAYLAFLVQHRSKLDSVNPLERLDKEVKRRADVVGIFPNEGFIVRLIGAVPMECNDEWTVRTRYMQVEAMVELLAPTIDAEPAQITADAA